MEGLNTKSREVAKALLRQFEIYFRRTANFATEEDIKKVIVKTLDSLGE